MYSNLKRLKPIMQHEIDRGSIHGSAIRVIHKNQIVYQDELGYADKENGKPIKRDTIYRIYSMSKPVTTVAAMILYERGLLDLLAPVSDFLEGFKNQKVITDDGLVNANRPATVRDLLNMTSGVVYPDRGFKAGDIMEDLYNEVARKWREGNEVNTIDFCNMIGERPLEFHPGERWRYGASADIVGGIIEVVSGKKLSQFMEDEIFKPLGMVDTAFYVPEEKLDRFSVLYEYIDSKKQLEICNWSHLGIGDFKAPPAFESGGAGLVSTIEDYSKFALMLANGGTFNGVRILSPKTVEFMTTPALNVEQLKTFDWDSMYGYNYSNLMRVLVDPVKATSNGSIGEFGWDGWTGPYFFVDPKENLVMLYMIQKCGGGIASLIRKYRNIIYSSIK